ncbi:hypothetical protein N0V83_002798 [Neocucurbitaria cava]|uniref:Lytic polysaccharide monooxygenase n=1 Tax=Neocucurbitaria cava TaxID=798079 RepID=A0A9W9CPZ4_9PLEO|nr:hypothetical protein N0V83_002798 [Neocucurbitaria cava]
MSFKSVFLAATAMLATVNAHVEMKSPIPYSVDKLDTSPITKAQYPCKSQNGFTVSTMNAMKAGEKQTLELSGSAVHGGGSCQLSVTLDTEPTANSVFKVIQSMEGGCPGVDSSAKSYDFTLPSSIPNGKATFAWTWFSKLSGGPELYMNCAPIEVTGGASDNTAFDALPNMLVANIDDTCKSVPNFAVQFPDPGSVVVNGGTNDLKAPTGSGCGTSSGTTPSESSPASGGASAAPTSAAATSAAATAAPTSAGGVFAPGASSAPAAVSSAAAVEPSAAPAQSTSTTLVTVTASGTAPLAADPTGTATPAQPTSGGSSGGSTCTTNGAVVCNGTTQFGLCNNGNVVWQDVAAGTTCANGVISKRNYNGRIARPRYAGRKVAI